MHTSITACTAGRKPIIMQTATRFAPDIFEREVFCGGAVPPKVKFHAIFGGRRSHRLRHAINIYETAIELVPSVPYNAISWFEVPKEKTLDAMQRCVSDAKRFGGWIRTVYADENRFKFVKMVVSDNITTRGINSPYCRIDLFGLVRANPSPQRYARKLAKVRERANKILAPYGVRVSKSALGMVSMRSIDRIGKSALYAASITLYEHMCFYGCYCDSPEPSAVVAIMKKARGMKAFLDAKYTKDQARRLFSLSKSAGSITEALDIYNRFVEIESKLCDDEFKEAKVEWMKNAVRMGVFTPEQASVEVSRLGAVMFMGWNSRYVMYDPDHTESRDGVVIYRSIVSSVVSYRGEFLFDWDANRYQLDELGWWISEVNTRIKDREDKAFEADFKRRLIDGSDPEMSLLVWRSDALKRVSEWTLNGFLRAREMEDRLFVPAYRFRDYPCSTVHAVLEMAALNLAKEVKGKCV